MPDRSAALSLRRRTSCIYCGQRISGRLDEKVRRGSLRRLRTNAVLAAAHVACLRHLDLPALDPNYSERL